MHVVGKSVRSTLFSVPDCQSIVKKAVVEAMKRKHHRGWFDESGPVYKIEVALLKDHVTLTIDTTGAGLHKRGYRKDAGEAPIKETLAAALVLLSRWAPSRILADPFCGSGTIPVEAALIGKNIAPGMNREFVAESWPQVPQRIWADVRNEARRRVSDAPVRILASDCRRRHIEHCEEEREECRSGRLHNIPAACNGEVQFRREIRLYRL